MGYGFGNYGIGYNSHGRYVDFTNAERQKFSQDMANYKRIKSQNAEKAKRNTIIGGIGILATIATIVVLARKGKFGRIGEVLRMGGKKAAKTTAETAASTTAKKGIFARIKSFFGKLNPFKKKPVPATIPTSNAPAPTPGSKSPIAPTSVTPPQSSPVTTEVKTLRSPQTNLDVYHGYMQRQAELTNRYANGVKSGNKVITDPARLLGNGNVPERITDPSKLLEYSASAKVPTASTVKPLDLAPITSAAEEQLMYDFAGNINNIPANAARSVKQVFNPNNYKTAAQIYGEAAAKGIKLPSLGNLEGYNRLEALNRAYQQALS